MKIYLVLYSDLGTNGCFIDSIHETKESAYLRLSKLNHAQQWIGEHELINLNGSTSYPIFILSDIEGDLIVAFTNESEAKIQAAGTNCNVKKIRLYLDKKEDIVKEIHDKLLYLERKYNDAENLEYLNAILQNVKKLCLMINKGVTQ